MDDNEVTAEDITTHASMLMALAELVRCGMLIATRDPDGDFRFKITDAGTEYVKSMVSAEGP